MSNNVQRRDPPTPEIAGTPTPGSQEELHLPVEVPNLKTRSMQEILNNTNMEEITHHGGSGNTYMANKVLKLQTMHDPTVTTGLQVSSDIFKGCCVFVNGDTIPTRYEIQRLVSG